jgi:hypothetical protein
MVDLITRPCPLAADIAIDITDRIDTIVAMLACHRSQCFEWLPYLEEGLDEVPPDKEGQIAWLRAWFTEQVWPRADRFRQKLIAVYGERRGCEIEYAEVYEISEYAAPVDHATRRRLFPFLP